MERFIQAQTKTNETLSETINQLTSKFDAMASHQGLMDTQIAQIAQQVSSLSKPQGQLPGKPETNPRGHINTIFAAGEGLVKSPMMVIQEVVFSSYFCRNRGGGGLGEFGFKCEDQFFISNQPVPATCTLPSEGGMG